MKHGHSNLDVAKNREVSTSNLCRKSSWIDLCWVESSNRIWLWSPSTDNRPSWHNPVYHHNPRLTTHQSAASNIPNSIRSRRGWSQPCWGWSQSGSWCPVQAVSHQDHCCLICTAGRWEHRCRSGCPHCTWWLAINTMLVLVANISIALNTDQCSITKRKAGERKKKVICKRPKPQTPVPIGHRKLLYRMHEQANDHIELKKKHFRLK